MVRFLKHVEDNVTVMKQTGSNLIININNIFFVFLF